VTRAFAASSLTQVISLAAASSSIDIETTIDWHERQKLLKLAFPLDIHADRSAAEIQFGHVFRPTHTNTSWDAARFEVAAHRFVDMSEHGYGVALLNDGKYGHHAVGNELGLTLLRSPVYPDPLADEGRRG
jgi:alpha-mannosidase